MGRLIDVDNIEYYLEEGGSVVAFKADIEQIPEVRTQMSSADCISRQAAIDEIDEWITAFRENGHKESAADACLIQDGIIQLPPAQPQRTGHWIPVGVAEVVGGESAQWGSAIAYHKCSECDEQALRDDFEQEVLSKWCPHCGANMVGVSE